MQSTSEPHAVSPPAGIDIALLQAQMACLCLCFILVLVSMSRGTGFHDDSWHAPMVIALLFGTYLRLQRLHKLEVKDAR